MKYFILTVLYCIVSPKDIHSQNYFDRFVRLSYPEKQWVIFHPFVSKKSSQITYTSIIKSENYRAVFLLDSFLSSGTYDAFRHAYWMAMLSQKIGRKKSIALGKAHEKRNYLQYKNGYVEDGILPDYASCEMDLMNNEIGVSIGILNKNLPEDSIAIIVYNSIKRGELRILKRDKSGNYLNCKNQVIDFPSEQKKWYTDRCIVPSNFLID